MRAKYKHSNSICAQTSDLRLVPILRFRTGGHPAWRGYVVSFIGCFVCQFATLLITLLCSMSPLHDVTLCLVSLLKLFNVLPLDDTRLLNSPHVPITIILLVSLSRFVHLRYSWSVNSSWFSKIGFAHQLFPHGFQASSFARHCHIIHVN